MRESSISHLLPVPAKVGHVPAIDGLRAIAVLAVIIYHAKPTWLPGGLTGVDIFFAISGFVVPASILWRPFAGPADALAFFYTRRIFRIFPALIVMLVATSFAVFLFVPRSWLGDGIVQTALSAFVGASNIVLYGLEGDYFSPQALFNPLLHTWSLGVEEQFYVVFSLLLFVVCLPQRAWPKALAYAALLLLAILSMVAAATTSRSAPAYAFYILPSRFWELGLGVLTYLGLGVLVPWLRGLRAAAFALLTAVCVLGLCASLAIGTDSSWVSHPFPAVLPAVVATAILMAATVARPKSAVASMLGSEPLRSIGLISYSLYLWHWPVFVLMRWTSGFAAPGQIGIGIVVSVLLAVLSYRFVEQPMRAFAATSTRPRRALIVSGLTISALALATVFGASKLQERISLSVTADTSVWFPYKMDAQLAKSCKVSSSQTSLVYGREITLTPACRGDGTGHTLFVAGDSHALALTRMLEGFASTTGMKVRIFARPGCTFVFPREVPEANCKRLAEDVFARLRTEASARDVVFFPGLRMPRIIETDGSAAAPVPALPTVAANALRKRAQAELSDLAARKVALIVEAPQPVFPTIPFRCSDWFNRHNPDCSGARDVRRDVFEDGRQSLLAAMRDAAKDNSSLSIWDPSDFACAGKLCRSWVEGRPWVFDGDHASGYSNDRMLPRFRDFIIGHLGAS